MADKTASFLASRLLTIPTSRVVVSVLRLFFPRGPTTVTGFVVPVVVNALNRHLWWSWPHVREKVLKCKPSITDLYSSTAIPVVVAFVRICCALLDAIPNFVFGTIRRAMCANSLLLKTTTAFVLSSSEVTHKRNASIPT